MSHFYMTTNSNRKPVTKTGTKNSGMESHIRGWERGVRVLAKYDEATKQDVFEVYATSGSNGEFPSQLVATINSKTREVMTHG